MLAKKICMVGAFAVGKSSLVRRYVESLFNEKYHTTIGVKIDKKIVAVDSEKVRLMIWDIEGVDIFTDLNPTYLRGASGIVLVVDHTRENSVASASSILNIVTQHLDTVPLVLMVNKKDLSCEFGVTRQQITALGIEPENTFLTSAKTGESVESAFRRLAELMLVTSTAE